MNTFTAHLHTEAFWEGGAALDIVRMIIDIVLLIWVFQRENDGQATLSMRMRW